MLSVTELYLTISVTLGKSCFREAFQTCQRRVRMQASLSTTSDILVCIAECEDMKACISMRLTSR